MDDIEINMPADDVLLLPGYAKKDAVRPPEKVGEDERGLVVKWFYINETVTMRWFGNPPCYRVAGVQHHPTMGFGHDS